MVRIAGHTCTKLRFDNPSVVIDQVRAHGDQGVDATASIIKFVGDGAEYLISDIEPFQDSQVLRLSAGLRAITTGFAVLQNKAIWYKSTTNPHDENCVIPYCYPSGPHR